MQRVGGDSEPEGQKECLRLKERVRGEKQIGAAGPGNNLASGRRLEELRWMGKKEARPKGCSSRKGKKTRLGAGIDFVLQEGCHGRSWGGGEG